MKKPTKKTQTAWVICGPDGHFLGRGLENSFAWVERYRAFHFSRREHAEALRLSVWEILSDIDEDSAGVVVAIRSSTVREVDL